MQVIRFIGSPELIALTRDWQVSPLLNRWVNWASPLRNGNKKDKPCLWFFPYENDSYAHGFDSPQYRLQYLDGIVADETHIINGKSTHCYICLHLDIERKDLTVDTQPYADPEGSYFDRIYVDELLIHRPYRKSEVRKVEIYADYFNPLAIDVLLDFKLLKTLTIDEAAMLIEPY